MDQILSVDREKTMDALLKLKINTLFDIVDELNYYQILKLSQDCLQSEIELSYQSQKRNFHPDLLSEADEELQTKAKYLHLSFHEAYEVLNEISGRLKYDHLLIDGQLRVENTKLLNAQVFSSKDKW